MLEPAGKVVEGFQRGPTMLGLSLLGLPGLPGAPGHHSASPSSVSFQLFSGQLSAGRHVPFCLLSPERTTEEEREGGAQGAKETQRRKWEEKQRDYLSITWGRGWEWGGENFRTWEAKEKDEEEGTETSCKRCGNNFRERRGNRKDS